MLLDDTNQIAFGVLFGMVSKLKSVAMHGRFRRSGR